ncbi:MAG: 2-phospho-L-lactate transferase [Chloroflexota bacterium]
MTKHFSDYQFVCLAGGVGGAKLADGLAQILPSENLTIIVNTGDDFQHFGLTICPDLDTVMYTLARLSNTETGWGRAGESWRAMEAVKKLGGPTWFSLGDVDLGTHLVRTQMLQEGKTLTAVIQHLAHHFGIKPAILPMSNQPAPTMIDSDKGLLSFQSYFVQQRWQPIIQSIQLPEDVRATPAVVRALEKADFVLIAPSNPFVSVDPILNIYPIRSMLQDLPRAVIGVSPIVGGTAVKGPAAKIMQELGMAASAQAVGHYFAELIDGFVYDTQDAGAVDLEMAQLCVDSMMYNEDNRKRFAQDVVDFALQIGG